jgi:hypothetical protein
MRDKRLERLVCLNSWWRGINRGKSRLVLILYIILGFSLAFCGYKSKKFIVVSFFTDEE